MGSPMADGGFPHSLSRADLQNYTRYGYKTSWVDRSQEGGVQGMGIITPACLIFELMPFFVFHTWILSRTYLQNYTRYGYEISWVDRSHQGGVKTLACLIFVLCSCVVFHTWILSRAYLQNYTSYGFETSWMDRSHRGGVHCKWIITLACLIFELLPFIVFHTWSLSGAYLKHYTSYDYETSWVDRSHQGGCSTQES